ncbi:MAG: hypothetical protein DMF24_03820 [Verrucomicrobia bacterium]|nr:MAG: hypothetical protein DME90_06330 [Verrucomicrobiota bacterium]PYL62502.1 MAG: hypothetical protein DMF24_03820 [Verrucomicrobiota bacterium]
MNAQESFRDKLKLLLVDKAILGAIAGTIAFGFAWYLHRDQLQVDYQKQMFEKRVEAYETIIAHAKILSDELLAFVAWSDSDVGVSAHEILWRKRLSALRESLEPRGGGSGGDMGTFPPTSGSVLKDFEALEAQRNTNALRFSKMIDAEIEAFMKSLWKEFTEAQKFTRPSEDPDEQPRRARIRAAYDRLRDRIDKSLAVDKIILG